MAVPDDGSLWEAVRAWEADGWQLESAERGTDGFLVRLVR